MSHIKQNKRSAHKPAVSLGVALLSGLALSSQASLANENAVEEVLVEGHQNEFNVETRGNIKFTEPISRTPKTIQVINSELISQQHATTLTEALRNTPGVGTFSLGEGGNTDTGDSIFMRGFYATGSIFADGIRDSGNYSRDTFNTEQVEVIKGADGSAFGRTSQGGAINVVSKMAKKGNSSEVTASYGTHNQKRTTVDTNHELGDNTAFRLNVMGEKSRVPGRDMVENKSWGIAPSLTFWLDDVSKISINYMHLNQDNTPDGGVPTIGLKSYEATTAALENVPKPRYKNFYGNKSDFDKVKVDMLTLAYENHITDNFTIHNTTRWGQTKQEYVLTTLGAIDEDWKVADGLSNLDIAASAHTKDQKNTIITNQLGFINIVQTGNVEQTLSYGLELIHEKVELVGRGINGTMAQQNLYKPSHSNRYSRIKTGADQDGKIDTAAIYFFDSVKFDEHWQLNAGVRFDHYRNTYTLKGICNGSRGAPSACGTTKDGSVITALDGKTSKDLFAWQLGLIYQINEQGNIYADYSVGEQPPAANGLVLSVRDRDANHPNNDPEKAKTAELGTKWKLADDKLLLSAAIFRTEIDNQLEEDQGVWKTNGKKRVEGIEITAVGKITDEWTLTTGYTHLRGKVLKGAPSAQGSGDSDLAYLPKDAFTAWSSYQLPLGFSIGAGARYIGKVKKTQKGAVGSSPEGAIDYAEGYWVGDMMLGYAPTHSLDFQLNVYNIADTRYTASVNRNGQRYTPHTPRTAILTAKYKF